MQKLTYLIILIFSISNFQCFPHTNPELGSIELGDEQGHLVIIGGGKRSKIIMQTIVDLAAIHGNGKLIVVPNASSTPYEAGAENAAELQALTNNKVEWVHLTPENVDSDTMQSKFDGVGGVYFSGGSQYRITKVLLGTKLLDKIWDIYRTGGVLSGTSAGAAIMSEIMLNGKELMYEGDARLKNIVANNVDSQPGFGFLKGVIIDQHFVKRQRENRLISLVIENPNKIGIGIDEQTAIHKKPDNTLEVLGHSNILIFDATHAVIPTVSTTTESDSSIQSTQIQTTATVKSESDTAQIKRNVFPLSAHGMQFHILTKGQKFDLKTLRVISK